MLETLGLIGCGNMGGAIFRGLAGQPVPGLKLKLFAHSRTLERCRGKGVALADSPAELAEKARIVILAVKPYQILPMLEALTPGLRPDQVIVSIAAGVSLAEIRQALRGRCPAALVMPNTPAAVGQGIFGLCLEDPALEAKDAELLQRLFGALGLAMPMPEDKMKILSPVAGCGPAYVFHFMDALMEAAVTLGFTRPEARRIVIQMLKGSVALAEQSGEHPAVLREQVCSPAGITIAAINHLDRMAVRGHIIDAVLAAHEKGGRLK